MRTTQQYEHISLNTQSKSMKPYPSSTTIVNEQSTISTTTTIETTVSNQQTTFLPDSSHHETTMMTENKLITTMKSQEDFRTSNNPMSTVDSTSTLSKDFFFLPKFSNFFSVNVVHDETTSIPEETSFTTYINRHFSTQSSTIINDGEKKKLQLIKKFQNNLIEEDNIDDLLFL
jgi:hypothetical protein